MGNCTICGKSAGFLRKEHGECRRVHDEAASELARIARSAALGELDTESLRRRIEDISLSGRVMAPARKAVLVKAFEGAVATALDDDLLTHDEQRSLEAFTEAVGLSQGDLNVHGAWERLVKAATLRDVMNGETPTNIRPDGPLPFNLQKSEKLVWLFPGSDYYEERTTRTYVGRSSGVSVRVMKGVYYRVGAFQGHPIESSEMTLVDSGLVGLTSKHIYFQGPRKSLRIAYPKIVSFQPYSDGLGVHKDTQAAKPQAFVTGDGWFIYNLVTNLSRNWE